eukprot:m.230672 g.230672  ORF g.230672 m.230672 type:complete len:87 (-) comp109338_c0_seq1:53-313(-)
MVLSSLVRPSNVGSKHVPLLCLIPEGADQEKIEWTPTFLEWHELTQLRLDQFDITVKYGANQLIPPGLTPQQDFTTIRLLIREIKY